MMSILAIFSKIHFFRCIVARFVHFIKGWVNMTKHNKMAKDNSESRAALFPSY